MKCSKCEGKGYIVSRMLVSGREMPVLLQCCDAKAYSDMLQKILNERIRVAAEQKKTDEAKARQELGHGDKLAEVIPITRGKKR